VSFDLEARTPVQDAGGRGAWNGGGPKMQPLALLFAIFVLSFVAGIGWYAGRAAVQFVAGIVGRGGVKPSANRADPVAPSEKKTLTVFK
jgi:hypothetical protein